MARTAKSVEENNPRTPFEALRMQLGLSTSDWSKQNDLSLSQLSSYETGKTVPSADIAKRIQDEARKKGIALTLDELYQNVAPFGEDYIKALIAKETKLLRANSALRRAELRREQELAIRKLKREEFIVKSKIKRNRESFKKESQSIEQNNEV